MDHWTNPNGRMPTGCAIVIFAVALAAVAGVVYAASRIFGW